jgi:hypothetical protein
MVCLYFISFFLKFIFCCSLSSTAHASCLFKNKMYVIGGHGDTYPTYNLIESDKTADVWYSENMSQFPLLPPSPTRPLTFNFFRGLDTNHGLKRRFLCTKSRCFTTWTCRSLVCSIWSQSRCYYSRFGDR